MNRSFGFSFFQYKVYFSTFPHQFLLPLPDLVATYSKINSHGQEDPPPPFTILRL